MVPYLDSIMPCMYVYWRFFSTVDILVITYGNIQLYFSYEKLDVLGGGRVRSSQQESVELKAENYHHQLTEQQQQLEMDMRQQPHPCQLGGEQQLLAHQLQQQQAQLEMGEQHFVVVKSKEVEGGGAGSQFYLDGTTTTTTGTRRDLFHLQPGQKVPYRRVAGGWWFVDCSQTETWTIIH